MFFLLSGAEAAQFLSATGKAFPKFDFPFPDLRGNLTIFLVILSFLNSVHLGIVFLALRPTPEDQVKGRNDEQGEQGGGQ